MLIVRPYHSAWLLIFYKIEGGKNSRTCEKVKACPRPKPIHSPLSLVTKASSRLEVGGLLG
ncbi:hypothetical protein [Aneurinibacillus thermoaerophilus]|uniref:hypothetical protein n=1 Tax=Aneurinibacillus thermoaerophilus TaxID=143495 RepID=UPI000A6297D1|nr:hypothetical protein [Aneurinibacillus thermoaerophilus]